MRHRFLRYPGGLCKAATLSYDDGVKQDVRFADTITKAGLKCTFNLNSDKLRINRGLTKEQVKKHILDNGHEIAVHGEMHVAQGAIRPIEGIREVLNCRLELENRYGIIVRGMAYPNAGITIFHNNANYESIKHYLTDLDIAYARTLGGDNNKFMLPNDWHAWMPTAHHNNPKIMEYIDEFLKIDVSENVHISNRYARLFYLWGHSYEFDTNNNWEHLDDICQKLGGHDDVWYATNMEIYDYVNAYNSLVFSADSTIVYNPTRYDVWFNADGTPYKVGAGETIKI